MRRRKQVRHRDWTKHWVTSVWRTKYWVTSAFQEVSGRWDISLASKVKPQGTRFTQSKNSRSNQQPRWISLTPQQPKLRLEPGQRQGQLADYLTQKLCRLIGIHRSTHKLKWWTVLTIMLSIIKYFYSFSIFAYGKKIIKYLILTQGGKKWLGLRKKIIKVFLCNL